MSIREGQVIYINGPVIKGTHMGQFKMREMVLVGENKLIAEVIGLSGDMGTIQVYEETEGVSLGETIYGLETALSLNLGPGLMGHIFDGIGRPLRKISDMTGDFMPLGIGLMSIDFEKKWEVDIKVHVGDFVEAGQIFAEVVETGLVTHRAMIPPGIQGTIIEVNPSGSYTVVDVLLKVRNKNDIITVNCSPCKRAIFYSNALWYANRVQEGENSEVFSYRISPNDNFIRCELNDNDGKKAWSGYIKIK